jgi:hydroxymethylglutaryl-CoA reductase
MNPMNGFSKLSKIEKMNKIIDTYFHGSSKQIEQLKKFWHQDETIQKTIDEFSENTISNFYFPFGVVPNVLINEQLYCVPMVIEESSVVAASARSANFWLKRGGIKTEVVSTIKVGQVHFIFNGDQLKLEAFFNFKKDSFFEEIKPLTSNMESRGGGLLNLSLLDKTEFEPGYFQLSAEFETCDAMGANFINSILEALGNKLKQEALEFNDFSEEEKNIQVVMCILSNYTPKCLVRAYVECPIEELNDPSLEMSAVDFVSKFKRAIRISKADVTRATTHNKGIMNGIDAVVIATGNDFRAIEACAHTYACRDGIYRGLSDVTIENGKFKFQLEIPLALGTVGGLTGLHPLAKFSLDLLGRPKASDLMSIVASIGLMQNFAAVRSLVTSGIQKGHMKMHLMNILNHLEATESEREKARKHFENEIISFKGVREFLSNERKYQ